MECGSVVDRILRLLLLPAMLPPLLFEDEAECKWPGGPQAKARGPLDGSGPLRWLSNIHPSSEAFIVSAAIRLK